LLILENIVRICKGDFLLYEKEGVEFSKERIGLNIICFAEGFIPNNSMIANKQGFCNSKLIEMFLVRPIRLPFVKI
jgi:hypothetical protein